MALIYDTMWHSTEKMTMAIGDGVAQEGVECAVLKLSASPRSEAARQVLESRAFLVGSPTLNNGLFPTVGGFLTYIKGLRPKNRIAGAYGSCGWAGGAVKQIDAELGSWVWRSWTPSRSSTCPPTTSSTPAWSWGARSPGESRPWEGDDRGYEGTRSGR